MIVNATYNYGNRFCRPCESQFCVARRIISMNPGIAIAKTKHLYRAMSETQSNLNTAFLGEDFAPFFEKHYNRVMHNLRQCPICAIKLFHTPIFQYEWLTHCPIHQESFMTRCHVCRKPFRKNIDIRNKCKGCGIVELSDFAEAYDEPQSKDASKRLLNAYKILFHAERSTKESFENSYVYFVDTTGVFQWKKCYESDLTYPSIMQHSLSDLDPSDLLDLRLETYSVAHKVVELQEVALENPKNYRSEEQSYCEALENLEALLPIDLEVTNTILDWVQSRTLQSHVTVLGQYHRTSIDTFDGWPHFCPSCFAFSLWFYSLAESKYALDVWSQKYGSIFTNSDCPWHFIVPNMYPATLAKSTADRHFISTALFDRWLYRRGLLIGFQQILEYCQSFDPTNLRLIKTTWFPFLKIQEPTWNKSDRLRKFEAFSRDNVIDFYYCDEDPLSCVKDFDDLSDRSQSCSMFQIALDQHNGFYRLEKGLKVVNHSLSSTDFLRAHTYIRSLLPAPSNHHFRELKKYRKILNEKTDYGEIYFKSSY